MMRAALGGDDSAYRTLLGELARAFRSFVRARLARQGRGNADIEDIVQEALMAIHLKRGTWDQSRPFSIWAQAVLAHKIADRLRAQSVRMHENVDALADHLPAEESDSSAASDLHRVLSQLDQNSRRIVTAMSVEGRSAAEVASELGSSEGAVRVALHRALARLSAMYRGLPR